MAPNATSPLQPKHTLRAHSAPVHTLRFCRRNTRLISGDEKGIVVVWAFPEFRPLIVWEAHPGNAVLGVDVWDDEDEVDGADVRVEGIKRVVT